MSDLNFNLDDEYQFIELINQALNDHDKLLEKELKLFINNSINFNNLFTSYTFSKALTFNDKTVNSTFTVSHIYTENLRNFLKIPMNILLFFSNDYKNSISVIENMNIDCIHDNDGKIICINDNLQTFYQTVYTNYNFNIQIEFYNVKGYLDFENDLIPYNSNVLLLNIPLNICIKSVKFESTEYEYEVINFETGDYLLELMDFLQYTKIEMSNKIIEEYNQCNK